MMSNDKGLPQPPPGAPQQVIHSSEITIRNMPVKAFVRLILTGQPRLIVFRDVMDIREIRDKQVAVADPDGTMHTYAVEQSAAEVISDMQQMGLSPALRSRP